MDYDQFVAAKSHLADGDGFSPTYLPGFLRDFQVLLTEWSIRRGRSAMFADCGLGKTPMQLVWAQNVVEHTNGRVLIVAPLAVSAQTVREGDKFGIRCTRSRDGSLPGSILTTNYERLSRFDPNDFAGVVCDESSAIKHFDGARQREVTEFLKKVRYRLLCTATAAPNDHIEFGTSSEALGELGRMDMLSRFFKNDENSNYPIWWGARWRFKRHAEPDFWRWVCSWSRTVRRPSDLGFCDAEFVLPLLDVVEHVVDVLSSNLSLIPEVAVTLDEQRYERHHTLRERCERVADLVSADEPAVVWCHLNEEADLLEKIIPGALQVKGSHPDEVKEERFVAFSEGHLKKLITKPRIGAFGLNWQHCAHMTFFPSHSFEQYYQAVRRCWRFGQRRTVRVDIVTTEGEIGVMRNMERKAKAADDAFDAIVSSIGTYARVANICRGSALRIPPWM